MGRRKRKYYNNDFSEGLAGFLFLCSLFALYAAYEFIKKYQEEITFLIIILGICAIGGWGAWAIIRRKKYLREVAIADKKMKRLKIERNEKMKLYEKRRLIEEEERKLLETARQKDWRIKEKLSPETKLFKVFGTELYSTYQPEVTNGEVNIVNSIISTFNPHCILVDSYFKKPDKKTCQIDIIAVGKRGVFVFESKDYDGWIFGSGNSQKWTQILAYGHSKHSFYNPIKQNHSHINVLKQTLGSQSIPFFSIVVLGRDAEIKKMEYVPRGVFVVTECRLGDLLTDLRQEPEVLSAIQVASIMNSLKKRRVLPQNGTRDKHVTDIKDMLGENRVYA